MSHVTHELETRRNRRVNYVTYAGDGDDDDDALLGLEEELMAEQYDNKPVNCYYQLIVKWWVALIMIITIIGISLGAGYACYVFHPIPDFGDDPQKGFDTRGTEISNRAIVMQNLYRHFMGDKYHAQPNVSIVLDSLNITDPAQRQMILQSFGWDRNKRPKRYIHRSNPTSRVVTEQVASVPTTSSPGERETHDVLEDISAPVGSPTTKAETKAEPHYCSPTFLDIKRSGRFVVKPKHGDNMMTAANLRGLCHLDNDLIIPRLYKRGVCNTEVKSLASYLLLLLRRNVNDCDSIGDSEVSFFKQLLIDCAPHHYSTYGPEKPKTKSPLEGGTLHKNTHKCHNGFIYNIFMALTEIGYLNNTKYDNSTHLPFAVSTVEDFMIYDSRAFYKKQIHEQSLANDEVKVVAVWLPSQQNIKDDVFNDYLLSDIRYFIVAAALIFTVMILYLHSLTLIVATVLNVGFSFILAYFIYTFVLQMKFFPFINILAGLVLIAVGADDVFVFFDCWEQIRRQDPEHMPLAHVMSRTFSHAALSIFVTSFTTAAAFFANAVSKIICIRCFAIFAGTAVLVNFVLMVTWTPAVIVLTHHISERIKALCSCPAGLKHGFNAVNSTLTKANEFVYGKIFPFIIGRLWFVWLFLLLGLGIGSIILVFVTPKLNLPSSKDFQLFPTSNLLENYDMNYAENTQVLVDEEKRNDIDVNYLWGFEPVDTGNKLDPDDKGDTIIEDATFDIFDSKSQVWITNFCHKLQNSTFVSKGYRIAHKPCIFEQFEKILETHCDNILFGPIIAPCCTTKKMPFSRPQLERCAAGLQLLAYSTYGASSLGAMLFDSDNKVKGFFMDIKTELGYSFSYNDMQKSYDIVDSFMNTELKSAPTGMEGGFFGGSFTFTFYDLQRAIANGTFQSIGLSLGVAFIVMLLSSLNILITIYAITTITLAILGTVGSIVLLGWDLNIIESITISLAVGLSIDFTIHYGVAYRLSKEHDPLLRVNESFRRVGSAVAMAALTTFLAGAAMIPCHIIPYIKLGIFLMLVMSFSWIYSTLFFQSLCRIAGPRGNFCQISAICNRCKKEPENAPEAEDTWSVESDESLLVTF